MRERSGAFFCHLKCQKQKTGKIPVSNFQLLYANSSGTIKISLFLLQFFRHIKADKQSKASHGKNSCRINCVRV